MRSTNKKEAVKKWAEVDRISVDRINLNKQNKRNIKMNGTTDRKKKEKQWAKNKQKQKRKMEKGKRNSPGKGRSGLLSGCCTSTSCHSRPQNTAITNISMPGPLLSESIGIP